MPGRRKRADGISDRQRALDDGFMDRALTLATRGLGRTHPNPAVGAVVVRAGRVVGEGYHRRAGTPHAEAIALRRAGEHAGRATLYVTLEPCVHVGRTPPCLDAVLRSRVRRVVIGMTDPDRRVRGRGVRALRRAGIEVSVGVRRRDCHRLLAGYVMRTRVQRPLVVLKLAASLDGRIAAAGGASRWITGAAARRRVHEMRNRFDAVMVGSGTVRADDPRLTCRLKGGRDPIRVVIDGSLQTSVRSRVIGAHSRAPTWLFTTHAASPRRASRLDRAGVEVVRSRGREHVDLRDVLRQLGARGVTSVLLEGGAELAAAALRARVVDRLVLFVSPLVIGGDGVPAVASLGTRYPSRALRLQGMRHELIGEDLVVEASLPFSPGAL
jgi:diaminohydroxyphosphoribosylaminopyrimidine deaminase/5-amino-6-(5-phosphoribosylamino)uracil reductase